MFFMYRYKTAYCPNIATKHDWTLCIYAHRFTDYRRPPDIYQYSPEECKKINIETYSFPVTASLVASVPTATTASSLTPPLSVFTIRSSTRPTPAMYHSHTNSIS